MDRIEERVFMWTIVWNAGERKKKKRTKKEKEKKDNRDMEGTRRLRKIDGTNQINHYSKESRSDRICFDVMKSVTPLNDSLIEWIRS